MATQQRKSRIQKKITKAQSGGNYGRANNLTGRLGNIATREGNRAVGNTLVKKAITGFGNTFKNAAGLPAKNLTANASDFKSTATINPATGKVSVPNSSISSPQTALQKAKIAVFDKKSNRGGGGSPGGTRSNLQNSGSLQSNMGFAGNSIVTGSSFDPNDTSTISFTPSLNPRTVTGGTATSFGNPAQINGPVDAVDTVVDKGATQTFSGGGEPSALRTGTTTAPAGSTATSGATTTGSGITLAPAGSEGYLGGYDYSLSNEERAQQEAYEDEQAMYERDKNRRVDREDIMRDTLRQFQGEIDAQNSVYAGKLSEAKLQGLDRLQRVRAENFNSGAVNSSFEEAAIQRANDYNSNVEGAINNEKLATISAIESAARELGNKYYQEKKAAKDAGLEAYMTSLGNAKTAKQAIANDIASNIIMSNFELSQIEPSKLESIAKSAGVSVQSIKSAYDEAKKLAEAEQIAAEQEAAKAERESQFNLSEGQARLDKYGNIIARLGKTYAPSSGGDGMNLTPGQINTTVNGIASAFDNEPIVKAYNTVQEGFQTINSIGVNTSSPADDIAFIYAFAKIMDPNSVVREGEYNTIQKYAQTWADNFGFKAKRIFKNSNFLTADAKQKMLNALKPKVDTVSSQYQNVYNEYQRQVQGAYTGQQRSITDYSGAYTQPEPTTSTPGKFDNIASSITIDGTNAYLPRSVWATVEDKDGLLAEAAADGYTLLID